MLKLVPKTIAADIEAEMYQLFYRAPQYIGETDERLVKIRQDLDRLGKVDAVQRSLLLVSYYMICGDREQAEYWAKNAKKLNADVVDIDFALLNLYVNLGYYSQSFEHLARAADPLNGRSASCLAQPMLNGAFHLFRDAHRRAAEMKIANLAPLPEIMDAAVEVMDFWGESDEDYAAALDIAGEVMRSRRLFVHLGGFTSEAITSPVGDGAPVLRLSLSVDVDFETSLEMTAEYLEKLACSQVKIPQSMVFEFNSAEAAHGD